MHLFIYFFVADLGAHVWMSEDIFGESILSFRRVNPGDKTRDIRLVRYVYPESHSADPTVRNLFLSFESPNLWYFCYSSLSEDNVISH